jgi:type IV pilus assembly protein PilB
MARKLGTILVDLGYLDEETLWKVLEEQKRGGGAELIGKVAVRMNLVNEDQVLKALGEQLGMKVIKLGEMQIAPEVLEAVNESMATAFKVLRIRRRSTACGRFSESTPKG